MSPPTFAKKFDTPLIEPTRSVPMMRTGTSNRGPKYTWMNTDCTAITAMVIPREVTLTSMTKLAARIASDVAITSSGRCSRSET